MSKNETGKEQFNTRRIIIGVIIIVVAILIATILVPTMSNKTVTYNVVVANTTIPQGVRFTKDNIQQYLRVYTTTDKNFHDIGYENPEALFDMYTTVDITTGTVITKENISKISVINNELVPEGKQLVGIAVQSVESDIGYMPQAGDIIRVYGLQTKEVRYIDDYGYVATSVTNEAFIYNLLQYVKIYSVKDSNGVLTHDSGNNPTNMVVEATTAQIEQIIEAQNAGSVYFSLVSSGDKSTAERLLAMQERIEEAYLALNSSETIEKHGVSIPLSVLTFDPIDAPTEGSVISLSRVAKVTRKVMNKDGTVTESEFSEYVQPEMMSFIEVLDVTGADGKSIQLSDDPDDAEYAYRNAPEDFSITLNLSNEQEEYLAEMLAAGQVFMRYEANNTSPDFESKMQKVDAAIRVYMSEKAAAAIEEANAEALAIEEEEKKKKEAVSETGSADAETETTGKAED